MYYIVGWKYRYKATPSSSGGLRAPSIPPPRDHQIHHQIAEVEKTGPCRLVLTYQGRVGKGKKGDGSCGVCHQTKVHGERSAKGWAGFPGPEIATPPPPDLRGRFLTSR